jgi:hypothetical protein
VRDQPVSDAIGCRKTASENIAPMPMHVISMPDPTTTQPYDSFLLYPRKARTASRGSFGEDHPATFGARDRDRGPKGSDAFE